MGDRRSGELGDKRIGAEALERERGDQLWRLARRDELGERRPDNRGRLEPVRPPAARDQETVHFGHAEDRAVVGTEVAQAGPLAKDLRALELWEELEGVSCRVLQKRERARAEIRRVRLDLRPDQEFATVGLVIGSGTPARSATSVDHPAVALITVPALISPRFVCTPVTRPLDRSMPVTLV